MHIRAVVVTLKVYYIVYTEYMNCGHCILNLKVDSFDFVPRSVTEIYRKRVGDKITDN